MKMLIIPFWLKKLCLFWEFFAQSEKKHLSSHMYFLVNTVQLKYDAYGPVTLFYTNT